MKKAFNLKKALICVLVLVLCIGVFVACDNKEEPQYDESSFLNAKTYLRRWGDEHVPAKTGENFTLIERTPGLNSVFYDVTWTATITTTEGLTEIDKVEVKKVDNVLTLVKVKEPSIEFNYTLKASFTDGTQTAEFEWNSTVPLNPYPEEAIDLKNVAEGTPYILAINQKNDAVLDQLYLLNEMSGYYGATTTDVTKAAQVYVELVKDGETVTGYKFYFKADENTNKYIGIVASGSYVNFKLDRAQDTASVFTWDSSNKCFKTTVGEKGEYYFGTYSTYKTVSASVLSYAKTSYPAFLIAVPVVTDAERLAKLDVPEKVSADFTLDDSATWEVKTGTAITLNGAKATVARGDEDQTVVLTATIGEASKDFTIVVEKKAEDTPVTPPTEETTLTIVIADYADANGWENEKISASAETDYYTVTTSCTNPSSYGQNTGKYYVNGENWRIYQNETPSLTITAKTGIKIVSVKVTYTVSNNGIMTQGDAQIASNTVVNVNADSISFSVAQSTVTEKANGQIRVTAIEVVCAAA